MILISIVTNSRPVLKLQGATWTDPMYCACASATPDYSVITMADVVLAPPGSLVRRFGELVLLPLDDRGFTSTSEHSVEIWKLSRNERIR
ncbi:hypothetical protein TNCV_1333531 [Trichonephila clavipes]|nr:hypothetical protein TNCV_1333531 [Trichonephila clavipes]